MKWVGGKRPTYTDPTSKQWVVICPLFLIRHHTQDINPAFNPNLWNFND